MSSIGLNKNIKIYGADWCSDCINIKKFLVSKGIKFEYIIITNNHEAISFVENVNNGKKVIPTISIDNKIMTNPGIQELISMIEE